MAIVILFISGVGGEDGVVVGIGGEDGVVVVGGGGAAANIDF